MEIEEIQATWSQLSDELQQQKKLTRQIILQMTQERYSNKFKGISTYETIGAIICFAAGLYMLFNFAKLDTWYLLACGIFTVSFLFAMPIMVLKALHKIKNIDILGYSYKDTVIRYEKAKKNLLMLQQFGVYASFILMFSTAAVFSKIWSNKDFFMVDRGVSFYVAIAAATVFVIFFARWGHKCYKSITASAESIINELE